MIVAWLTISKAKVTPGKTARPLKKAQMFDLPQAFL